MGKLSSKFDYKDKQVLVKILIFAAPFIFISVFFALRRVYSKYELYKNNSVETSTCKELDEQECKSKKND